MLHSRVCISGTDPGGPWGPGPPTTKIEVPAPKFYKIEAPEWQFRPFKNFFLKILASLCLA